MVRVRFKKYGASTALGEFGPGTIARVSEALAAHFVVELAVAEYLAPPTEAASEAPIVAQTIRGRGKRK